MYQSISNSECPKLSLFLSFPFSLLLLYPLPWQKHEVDMIYFIPSFFWNPEEICLLFNHSIYSAITLYWYQWLKLSYLPSLLHILWYWFDSGPHHFPSGSLQWFLYSSLALSRKFSTRFACNNSFKIIIISLSLKNCMMAFNEKSSGVCSDMTNQTHVMIPIPF